MGLAGSDQSASARFPHSTVSGSGRALTISVRRFRPDVGPRLRRIELQLDALQAELNLATEARLAALQGRIAQEQVPDAP